MGTDFFNKMIKDKMIFFFVSLVHLGGFFLTTKHTKQTNLCGGFIAGTPRGFASSSL